jgi:thiamine biosynthesis lipoprotein
MLQESVAAAGRRATRPLSLTKSRAARHGAFGQFSRLGVRWAMRWRMLESAVMKMRHALPIVLLGATVLLGCERPTGDAAGPAKVEHARPVMGTFAEVTAWAPDEATARAAVEAAYTRLDDVNRLMSDYVDDSEVGRINALEPGASLQVSRETFGCLEAARRVAEQTGGAFDVTCRPLVQLWKRAGKAGVLPSEEALAGVRARVGWQKLKLDPTERRVSLAVAGMQVDLGGIAKGFALDLAAEALREEGATGGLVDVGGDVVAVGTQPSGEPWRIGVQHPAAKGLIEKPIEKLSLADAAVATSGVQQRFVEIDGKRYSHIIDPRTGRPAEQAPSVTVIAPDGATADAWATALSVLSVAEGQALLARGVAPGVEVLWITLEDGAPQLRQTPGFAEYVMSP